ncbi:energy-coupling factor transport system ATP-binding protein [Natranaerovirga hydrolytica]|uniref:Energy-coupling factor transport system ATP-binding protein n=1 Tax=Natranaerovirga hydrolytica TaxID=680378 RepID=A0A4R1N3S8_9FIRM|nr:ABC transporter ATP-binding protein [Natranaerovirga hydrolytica]TCK98724.1 energy-coupling factor transport system ATP-binding protein [Natranaerovirga hydrolytica]
MIELKNVSFSYGCDEKIKSIQNINLSIKKGEVILLCGESGCGKTTITRLINGLIPHYYDGHLTGEIMIKGHVMNETPIYNRAKCVGSIFQNPRSQFFNVDTNSELVFGCENMGLSIKEINNRLEKTVSKFRIKPLMNRSIFQLSGGEKQKIACASISMLEPDIIVLDEPSSNLDIQAIEDLRRLIEFWKSNNKTIIIAEHRLYFLEKLVNRIVYMKNGQIKKEYKSHQIQTISPIEFERKGLRPLKLEDCYLHSEIKAPVEHEMLELSNFKFYYKKRKNGIQFNHQRVPKEGTIAIIGHNGAGKSTFARCLCGLEKRSKGTLIMDGISVSPKDRLKKCFMVMQDVNHQLFTESVLEEILLSMNQEDVTKAEEVLRRLDILSIKECHPMSLSGGQKQRVAISSAIASERELLIFDEPTSGLDLRHMKEVAYNLQLLKKMKKTTFIITHDLELILQSCTHVLHFEEGTIIDNYPLDKKGCNKLLAFFIKSTNKIQKNQSIC